MAAIDFDLPSIEVARALIGASLYVSGVGGRIVETEAYDQSEPASHTFGGQTLRNAVMFGPSGRAYVYRSYGLHWCLNVVCMRPGHGAGVLIRAIEPTRGIAAMRERRGQQEVRLLFSGPGRLCQALGVTHAMNGLRFDRPPFRLVPQGDDATFKVASGTRIGITKSRELHWRFVLAGSAFLSKPMREIPPPRRGARSIKHTYCKKIQQLVVICVSSSAMLTNAAADFNTFVAGRRFKTVLADPPWQFQNKTGKVAPEHKRLARYATLKLDEIKALPVEDAVADSAHLYLWVPNALLPEGLAVMQAWGFRYKANIVWQKIRKDGGPDGRGVGFYFRNVTELLLFGVRGKNVRTLAPGRTQVNTIATRKREHSRKPDEQFPLITSCSPGPYLEMFARGERPGWAIWGDQAGGSYVPDWPTYANHSQRDPQTATLEF